MLEFPDGRIVLLTHLCEGQKATVLQLAECSPRLRRRKRRRSASPLQGNICLRCEGAKVSRPFPGSGLFFRPKQTKRCTCGGPALVVASRIGSRLAAGRLPPRQRRSYRASFFKVRYDWRRGKAAPMSRTTPHSYYKLFVVPIFEDYLRAADDIRLGFNASVPAFQLADVMHTFYSKRIGPESLSGRR